MKIVIGNWKMYPTLSDALVLAAYFRKNLVEIRSVEIVLAVPLPFLIPVIEEANTKKTHLKVAAQLVSPVNQGAFTGQVSAYQLKDLIDYALIGHSETRQYLGVTNERTTQMLHACLAWRITPVLCIGEEKRMISTDNTIIEPYQFAQVTTQLMEGIVGVKEEQLENLVVTYEPVWAIGTKTPATALYSERVILRLKDKLTQKYSRSSVEKVRFLYGGSVDAHNADEILRSESIDGVLVGGASVKAKEFKDICQIAASIKN